MIKNKIVKALTETRLYYIEKILTRTLFRRMKNTDNEVKSTDNNKIAAI